ncbi:MAG: hypothetical protein ABSC51_11355, partial [Gaiellaceae bacterium]|jgi:hypothetical protein
MSAAVRSFTVDTIAPQTTIASGPAGPTSDRIQAFAFSSSEAGSSFACRLDSGKFTPCSSPLTTAVLPDGAHIFYVRATDQAHNTERRAAVRSFTVDTVAPQTTIVSGPSGSTNNSTPTFTFSSSETGSTFECALDDSAFASCSSPYTTAVLPDGTHALYVRAIDQAGNPDMSAADRFFAVETKIGKIFARLSKKSFTRSQAGKVRLVYRFSPRSKSFHYVLVRIDGASWRTVRNVTHSGDFKGLHSMPIKALFAKKPIANGRYRLIVSADRNRELLPFEII